MSPELENKLVEKYPKFFEYLKEYNGDIILPMQFGIECRDGWYWLLDNLMGTIQSYIDNNSKRSRIKNKFLRYIQDKLRRIAWKLPYKYSKYLHKYSSFIFNNAKWEQYTAIEQVEASQIKEKYGGLRFYTNGHDDRIDGMIWLAESMSYSICEECGSTNNVTQTKGWIISLCESCMIKYNEDKVKSNQLRIEFQDTIV